MAKVSINLATGSIQKEEIIVGIDLGTTNSLVAFINPDGQPLKDSDGNVVYSLEGRAPEVREDFFGTGFIVAQNAVLTNHHVAQPWWKNDEMSAAAQQGLQPTIAEMTAYFPEAAGGIPL